MSDYRNGEWVSDGPFVRHLGTDVGTSGDAMAACNPKDLWLDAENRGLNWVTHPANVTCRRCQRTTHFAVLRTHRDTLRAARSSPTASTTGGTGDA